MTPERPQFIGDATAKVPPDSAEYWQAGLFRMPDEVTFLLAGTGGVASDFASDEGETGRVIQMTENEAFNWAASYLSIDTVEEFFDHLIEEI